MTDNRFGYMRKHLGFSQKDASRIFSTRLDTIKKWDTGKLFIPGPVLEEMFDYISSTRALVSQFVEEIECENEDDPIDEVYLKTFTVDELEHIGLPPSIGWLDNAIGAIIGALPSLHVYGSDQLPDHYDPDFHWHEYWNPYALTERGGLAVEDEAALLAEIRDQLAKRSVQVAYDPDDHHYHIGFTTKTLGKAERTIWIKACHGGKYADQLEHWHREPPKFCDNDGKSTPYVKMGSGPVMVGLRTDHSDNVVDAYTLAELIFGEFAAICPTENDLLAMCREVLGHLVGADEGYTSDFDVDWAVKDTRFMTHKFIAALFFETKKQTGKTLHPEAMVEICKIAATCEPSIKLYDHETLEIDMGGLVYTIVLDLRDILTATEDGRDFQSEAEKALEVIKASIGDDSLTILRPFSRIDVTEIDGHDQS